MSEHQLTIEKLENALHNVTDSLYNNMFKPNVFTVNHTQSMLFYTQYVASPLLVFLHKVLQIV